MNFDPGRDPCSRDGLLIGGPPTDCRRLSKLPPGEAATLCRLERHNSVGDRLADLGLVPGTRVRVIRRAPLGDPLEIELRGTHFCLREQEARRIWVHPLRAPA